MDEVLVDFITAACEAHGITREQMEHYRAPGTWSIQTALGHALTAGAEGLTDNEFWSPIHHRGVGFWEHLNKLPWYDEVIAWAENNFNEWYIVSAPSKESCSYTGKVNWLKREFGNRFDKFFLTPHKEMLAAPDRLLVDDRKMNLFKFMSRGGEGLLFPTKGGPLYHIENIVEYLNGYSERTETCHEVKS